MSISFPRKTLLSHKMKGWRKSSFYGSRENSDLSQVTLCLRRCFEGGEKFFAFLRGRHSHQECYLRKYGSSTLQKLQFLHANHLQGSLRPAEPPKSLKKVSKRSFKGPFRDFFQTLQTSSRLFPDFWGGPRTSYIFQTFSGFRARSAREALVNGQQVPNKAMREQFSERLLESVERT